MVTVIGVLLIIMGIFLVISVLMQSSKNHRVSGSIAGGAETFFGKQKGKTLDALFNKLTTVVTILFVILVLALCFILPTADEAVLEQYIESMQAEGYNITADDVAKINADGTIDYVDYEAFVAKNADKFVDAPAEDETVVDEPAEEAHAEEETPAEEVPAEEVPAEEEAPAEVSAE